MSVLIWTNDKNQTGKQRQKKKRLVCGPAMILAMALGSSAALAVALLLFAIVEL